MNNYSIIVVDDEEIILESIKDYFPDYDITTFCNSNEALEELKSNYYDIIIADYKMPDMTGLELLIESKKIGSYYYGILLTAFAEKKLLEEFINKNLIKKVLEKPLELDRLKKVIQDAVKDCQLYHSRDNELSELKLFYKNAISESEYLNKKIIGIDSGLRDIFKKIPQIAKTNENVLITGETGTGKEIIARTIHTVSHRKNKPFIRINCGAIPEHLIESELFGYNKGAFTGANTDKEGKIELADKGTLFLDEIGELKPDLQIKLLHVIQEKKIERLGSNITIDIDFRLISATNKDIESEIRNNTFREDLYYRISTIPLDLPPLRDRPDDIEPLIKYFVDMYSLELNRNNISISESAIERLKTYMWPGNIREMENVIKRAIILLDENENKIGEDSFFYLFLNIKNESTFKEIINHLSIQIIEKKKNLKSVGKLILNSILKHFNGNIMEAVRNTNISKNKFYRNSLN